ncbi:MAG: hypothetical protein ACTSPG_08215 [Candidatus Hodarchaeales archaeon]
MSGSWYCPKCGKKSSLLTDQLRSAHTYRKKVVEIKKSKDEIYDQIYTRLTIKEKKDLGYKSPYLNPSIKSIEPKQREKIRLFYKR